MGYENVIRIIQEFMLQLGDLAKNHPDEYQKAEAYWTDKIRKIQRMLLKGTPPPAQ